MCHTANKPENRIADAAAQIAEAMAEQHPAWRYPQIKIHEVPVLNAEGRRSRVGRHAALIFASEEKFGPEEGMWWVRDAQ